MLKSYFQIVAYDDRMSRLRQTPRRRSRSFLQAFLKLHFRLLDQTTSITITDISGTSRSVATGSATHVFSLRATGCGRAGANLINNLIAGYTKLTSDDMGIVAGTGTTAVTPTDFALATQVADGITSGTLEHFPSSGGALTISAPTGSFTLERLFRNSSGGGITVNEVGVYASLNSTTNLTYSTGIIRDLVSPGFSVANGEYMRIIYTISVTA